MSDKPSGPRDFDLRLSPEDRPSLLSAAERPRPGGPPSSPPAAAERGGAAPRPRIRPKPGSAKGHIAFRRPKPAGQSRRSVLGAATEAGSRPTAPPRRARPALSLPKLKLAGLPRLPALGRLARLLAPSRPVRRSPSPPSPPPPAAPPSPAASSRPAAAAPSSPAKAGAARRGGPAAGLLAKAGWGRGLRLTGGQSSAPSGSPAPSGPPAAPPRVPGGRRRWLGRMVGWSISLGIWLAMGLGGVIGYYAYDLPPLENLTATSRKPSVTLLSVDGQSIAAYGDVYGEPLALKDVPPALPAAVTSTEDRHFYTHFGIDLIGLGRAVVVNARAGHVVQGGSTITQQLAKNLFLTPERNMKRKIQELLMALWLEHKFTKEQIITLYLNRVYLGSGTWGVDAAARRYFDVSARNLNLYQSALLAGLLKAPSKYNPQNDRELSYKRTSQVLANMVAVGAITEQQAQEALRTGPATVRQISHTGRYFADWIRDQVDQYAHGDRDIVVHTTLDMTLQHKVETEIEDSLAKNGAKAGVSQGAAVVMSPDGAIRALSGGRDYATSQFNRAVQGMRQPGSSFKAFLYLAAVEAGWTAGSTIDDAPIKSGKYQPENYTNKYEGPISLRRALAKSSNVAAVRLIESIGPKRVVGVAKRLGITSDLRADASLALGTSEVSLVEMTAAYASFANDGNGVFPYGFSEITDNQGNIIYIRQGNGTGQVIEPRALREINYMLSGVIEEGSAKAAAIDRPAAGKTGTTQDYRDAWFIGFTADYVGGVWFGNDDGTPMHKITGGSLPTQLWHNVMLAAHKGLPVRPLPGLGPEPAPAATAVDAGGAPPSLTPGDGQDGIWNGIVKMFGG